MTLTFDFTGHVLTVDPSDGTLVGAAAQVKLEPKVMDLLVCLGERAGEVVDRETLLERLWADRVVTDDVLARSVYQLRRQLKQAIGADISVIETLRKRGYRLQAGPVVSAQSDGSLLTDIEPHQPATVPGPPGTSSDSRAKSTRTRWLGLGLLALLAALTMQRWLSTEGTTGQGVSIAVLPFVNMSDDASVSYFGDGLAEELIHQLTLVDDLRVVARTSSFHFRDQNQDIREIGDKLGVTHLIEGSVRKDGEQVLITAQLIDTSQGLHVWSRKYDTALSNLFVTQHKIAIDVANTLRLDLTSPQRPAPTSSEAYLLYLQGRAYMHQRSAGALTLAIDYFAQAVESDPGFAPSLSGLADAHMLAWQYGEIDLEVAVREARTAVDQAMRLNANLPEVHASLGLIELQLGNYQTAEPHLRRATALDSNYAMAHMWLGRTQYLTGKYSSALAAYEHAATTDPLSPIVNMNVGRLYCDLGDPDRALTHLSLAAQKGEHFANSHWAIGYCHWLHGRYEAARTAYERALELNPNLPAALAQLARVSLDLGDQTKAQRLLDEADDASRDGHTYQVVHLMLAILSEQLPTTITDCTDPEFWSAMERGIQLKLSGQIDRSTACLSMAYELGPDSLYSRYDLQHGLAFVLWLAHNYQSLGQTEEFEQIIERMNDELALLRQQRFSSPGQTYLEASVLALSGEQDQALVLLAEAIGQGWRRAWWMRIDPAWQELRAQPRFQQLLQRTAGGEDDSERELVSFFHNKGN